MKRGIYLVGFSGTGKSTVARIVAEKLKCAAYDLDARIEQHSGMSIPAIFEREGEAGFRLRETAALREMADLSDFVIATGGGTFISAGNRELMAANGWTICLEGRPQTLLSRIQGQLVHSEPNAIRPLLDALYPLDQIRALKNSRQAVYALADWTVHTDRLSVSQIADEVIRAARILDQTPEPAADAPVAPARHSLNPDSPPPIAIGGGPWPYYAVVDWGHLPSLGSYLRRVLPNARRAAILTDAYNWERLGQTVAISLRSADLDMHLRETLPRESVKTLDEVKAIYDWLLDMQFRRDDVLIIIGGGAIDDAGSFAASTYMRGVPLVKVPMSLEGIVDGSIGGKTALNHPRARNLIGTFYHPALVWSDLSVLESEDREELRSAWAEVVKYAMLESSLLRDHVMGVTLFEQLEREVDELRRLNRAKVLDVAAKCVALKAHVVAADERDVADHRIFLNYGHTVAHALVTATRYRLLHGDAVAIGMAVEAALAVRLGLAPPELEQRQNRLLERFHLPTRLPDVPRDEMLQLMNRDKKVSGGAVRWILPVGLGRAVVSSNVAESDVVEVMRRLARAH